jgi:hypothetical protein
MLRTSREIAIAAPISTTNSMGLRGLNRSEAFIARRLIAKASYSRPSGTSLGSSACDAG